MSGGVRCPHHNNDCEMLSAYEQTKRYALDLHSALSALRQSKKEIEEAYQDTVRRLAMAVEYRDNETGAHVMRLGRMTRLLAKAAGADDEFTRLISQAAPMHDVGKIGIPDKILLKPGKLTPEEFEVMKRHTIIGAELLDKAVSKVMRMARSIAFNHHERFDGNGYPSGIKGEAIPLEGRIVAIVDVFDALSSKRPYKEAFPVERVVGIMVSERGAHFDPTLLDIFLNNLEAVQQIREEVETMGGCNFGDSVGLETQDNSFREALDGGDCSKV